MKKWILIGGVAITLILVAVFVLLRPSVGTLVKSKPTEVPSKNTVNAYNSDYLSFKYKNGYTLSKIDTTDGRVLENLKIMGGTGSTVSMVITLRTASQELSEISGVQMRRATTWQYSEEVARMGETRGLLFRTADKKERTAFFKKNDGLLTISMTTNSNDPADENEFQDFLNNFIWK